MNKLIQSSLLVTALIALSACSTTAKVSTIPGMGLAADLKRSDYIILGTATGEACATEDCFFGSCNKKASVAGEELLDGRTESSSLRGANIAPTDLGPLAFLFGTGNVGPTGSEIAEKIALYKAIESIPNAHAIITPRKEIKIKKNDILGISTTTESCVKVMGKAIHVKSDAEMAGGK
jgi:hypothetical protein